jgi:hypothetical protein
MVKKRLAIVGAGSAGLQSACHLVFHLPKDWEITLVHNPSIPSLGIGESSNGGFPFMLVRGLQFELSDMEALDATNKFGTWYKDWRPTSFMGPLVVGSHAFHFNTHKFAKFAIPRLHKVWGSKFAELQGNVEEIINGKDSVELLVDGKVHTFDYVVNCMGFPKDFTDYSVFKDHPVNHCVVHNIAGDYSSINYTGHTATVDGWMFEVPLKTRLSHGYLFNDTITSVEEARKNLADKIKVPLELLDNIEYRFTPYISKKVLKGRVFSNGNQAYFMEPMFANSLMTYNNLDRILHDHLVKGVSEEQTNLNALNEMNGIKQTIYYKYHGGSIYESPFWKNTKKVTKSFSNSDFFKQLKHIMHLNGTAGSPIYTTPLYGWEGWLKFEKYLGYNTFTKP